jgi:hypothetical protein
MKRREVIMKLKTETNTPAMDKRILKAARAAKAQYESIKEMVQALKDAEEANARKEAKQAIQEDPLSVREGWRNPGEKEFNILLCTGGPAVRIIGKLGEYGEPFSARLQYQDWFTSWEDYRPEDDDAEEILLTYCRQNLSGILIP